MNIQYTAIPKNTKGHQWNVKEAIVESSTPLRPTPHVALPDATRRVAQRDTSRCPMRHVASGSMAYSLSPTHLILRFALFLALLLGTIGAKADDYVLAYVNGSTTYYLARNGTTGVQRVTDFDPTTCVWSCASNTAGTTAGTLDSNTNGYLYQTVGGTRYFLNASANALGLGTNAGANNYYRWRTNGTYVYNRYNNSTSYYINLASGVARSTSSSTTCARPCEVTTSTVAGSLTGVTISGDETLTATGTYSYSASGTYTNPTTNYYFNNANHYSPAQTTSTVTTSGTWTVSGTGASYVSVNASTGAITVNSLPTDADKTITLQCEPEYNGTTASAVTKTITLKADTRPVGNPTGITATNMSMNQWDSASGNNYTLTAAAGNRPFDWVTAESSDPAIASITNTEGAFTITANAVGTATITITAYNQDKTTVAATTTFTVTVSNIESGVSGGVVTLNDYEDHNWTYYKGVDNSVDGGNYNTDYVGKLYSPDPRNVKITYKANGGAVSIDESETEFVYYKTIEKVNGAYNYTVISNPFSKRPNGKGFGGWRIKEGAQYINGYADEEILPLDQELTLTGLDANYTPNCTSAEIELEATWVNLNNITYASGNTITYSVSGGTYETNILVLNRNVTGTITTSSPVTIMMVEPDGSSDYRGTYTFSGNITPSNTGVTKIEYARWTTTGDINATGRNFTIGRGIRRPSGGGTLYGTNTNRNINQTFKVESGIYENFYAIGASGPSDNMTKQHIIFGNDYDRATSNNENLTVTNNMMLLNRAAAIGTDLLVVTMKSGKFTTELVHTTAQASSNCFYLWNNNSTNASTGVRTLIIEGGEFWHIAGGVDYSNSNNVVNLKFRMKGGTVHGSIYGGAARYDAHGGKQFVFTGGTIEGWIAGGSNGFLSEGSGNDNGTTQGNSYVYVGGTTQVNSGGSTTAINVSLGGNVYGAGCGNEDVDVSGRVTLGTNVVVADESYVERGVYGGGAYGGSPATANVYITGNAHVGGVADATFNVQGGVYGGARAKGGGSTNIYMTGGLIETGLYGGSNRTGTLTGSANLIINGGQVGTSSQTANIHGGGYGSATIVSGNVDLTLGTAEQTTPGVTVYGNTYGGGSLGKVQGSTTVNITKGYVSGTVFGGGMGSESDISDGQVYGNALVDMRGGTVLHSIYGGGELASVGTFTASYADGESDLHIAGEPKTCQTGTGLTKILISGGTVGHLTSQVMPDPTEPTSYDDYGYVFGGCMGAGYIGSTEGITEADANANDANKFAVSATSEVTVSGGLITASVYGGSENGQVIGNTSVTVSGGQIGTGYDATNDTWDGAYTDAQWNTVLAEVRAGTFKDTDATDFHTVNGWDFAEDENDRHTYDYYAKYLYDGIYYYDAAHTKDSNGGSNESGDGQSYFGNVFGGGSGYYPVAPGVWRRAAGRVCGNSTVTITGGHILNCVYGGNETTDVLGTSTVEMTGGTVGVPRTRQSIIDLPTRCNLYGGCKGDPRIMFNQWSNVGSSVVSIGGDAVVFGSVFAGGEDGHVGDYLIPSPTSAAGNATTTISGNATIGTFGSSGLDGNVFGGGRGYSALALTAGVVTGNISLTIEGSPRIWGSVYGGGRLAAVGTYLVPATDANYGIMQDGAAHGNITIDIKGGTIGREDQLSHDSETIHVGDVYGGSKGTLMKNDVFNQRLGLSKNTTINISQASGNTTTILGNVYGGGEIASVGSYIYATTDLKDSYNTAHPNSEQMKVGDIHSLRYANTGKAIINITGGTIGQASLPYTKGHVFGGCLGRAGTDYTGYSFVNTSDVTLNGGTVYGSVFGGGENGHVLDSTYVKIQSGTVGMRLDNVATENLDNNMLFTGNVYGGGRGVDLTSNNDYSVTAGKVFGNTRTEITGGTIYRNVYGGGSLACVGVVDEPTSGRATVIITGGQIGTDGGASANNYATLIPVREHRKENGFVFGSGRGMAAAGNSALVRMAYTKNTVVTVGGSESTTAYVTGSVFGGGENGHVRKNTKVYIKDNCYIGTELIDAEHEIDDNGRGRLLYRGNVYGAGRGLDYQVDGSDYSLTAGRVEGDAYVEVSGGYIYHDVFGGGSLASVGTPTVNETTGEVTYTGTTGNTYVTIKGGVVGYSSTYPLKQGFNCGFVYGGCRGLAAAPNSQAVEMAYVHSSNVYIQTGADIKGSVFGGGANGHVKNDSRVEITGGSIGTPLLEGAVGVNEVGFDDYGVAVKPVFRGNVYAGGRGVDQYQQSGSDLYSLTAGAVYGNATLEMSGGHVWHNVYGSGAMASVGTVEEKTPGTHVHDEVVDAGGNIVNPDGTDVNYLTGMFTSGTGEVRVTITGGIVGDTTPGHEGRNNGRVYGAGRGVSASRSDYVASMEFVKETIVNIGTSGQTSYTAGNDAPYIYGAVFGGGENGHVKNDTHVNIHSGIIGWPLDEGASQEYKTAADGSSKNPFRGHVFGGGRGVDIVYHGVTEERSSTAGRVYGHTNVTMTGGVVRRAIYGGGLLASVGMYRLLDSDMHIIDMIEDEVNGGDATITISGGYIGNVNPDGTPVSVTGALAPGDNNGHVFGSSCGMVADTYTEDDQQVDIQYRQMGYTHSTHVDISGDGHLFGSVFGSGENGHVWEDTQINISGGEIGSEANTSIYAGNVYGSGRGVDHPHAQISETAGKVRGNTTVNITGGTVWRDVYGGGSLASVGEADEEAQPDGSFLTGTATVNILGTSAIHGSVYGSGRGVASPKEEYKQAAYVKNTLVNVSGGHVFQNVFGGGNAGHVRRNTDVTINGTAKVDGNVYGGGAGDISSPTAGLVNHDVVVNILGGLIAGDVYGGGAIANTNVHDKRNTGTYGNPSEDVFATTKVNLTGGIILGDAYGGGQGVIAPAGATPAEIANAGALVRGDVTVTLNGTAFYLTTKKDDQENDIPASGRVFGCNNLNGTPQGTVLVRVAKTTGVTATEGSYAVNNIKPDKDTDTYEVQAVYGGGNLAAYEPWNTNATGQYTTNHDATNRPLQVLIDGCDEASIEYVYGGGNAAATPSTAVIMLGCYEVDYLFGGGNGKDRISYDGGLNYLPNPGADVGMLGGANYGTGKASVDVLGGTIHSIFGGSNTKGDVRESSVAYLDENSTCPLWVGEVYGGGNEAYMSGGSEVKLGCITSMNELYGGAKAAPVGGDIVLTITSGHFDRVFGGNNISGDISGSITVNIEETGCKPVTIGELYGCGNQAAYTTPAGKTDPTINIKSCTSIGRVFGGGLGSTAVVTGNPTVNINEVTGLRSTYSPWTYPGSTITYADGSSVTLPTHESGKIGAIGTVFGGGNEAEVVGNTNVLVGTQTGESIIFVSPEDATEAERTHTVEGADITGNVFGGGNNAKVTGNSNVVVGKSM